jgi:hypothetical protein
VQKGGAYGFHEHDIVKPMLAAQAQQHDLA